MVAVATALVGAGHGGGASEASKSAGQITTDAYHAAVNARSVRLEGSYANSGTHGELVGINLVIRQNKAFSGSLTIQGDPLKAVVIGPTAYVSASSAYYESQGESASEANLLSGKWLKLSTKDSQNYVLFEHLNQLLSSLAHPTGTLSKAGTTTVGGKAAVLVKSSGGATVAVATHGAPFPLEILAAGNGTLRFTGWNKPVTIKKPASFIDLSKQGS